MIAIKGTNEIMRCLGYQYELGKTHKMDDEPIPCERGFHACLNPYDVVRYYKPDGYNRYFLVNLGGSITDCDYDDTKVASNEITFLKEITDDDFPALYDEFIQDKERIGKLKYNEGFSVIRKGDKYNFIDHDGKYISQDWFDFVCSFDGGFASVNKDEKYNYIDHDGKLLCEDWFDDTYDFHDGFVKVKKDDKYNFIDHDGKLLCYAWFDDVWFFSEGFALVEKDGKYNFIDKEGKLLSKDWFDDAYFFTNRITRVAKDRTWYWLYTDGHLEEI